MNLGNLASTVATGHAGSTTVAATIAIASRAGIGVMAAGGTGGVHRDVPEIGDVSADLTALARSRNAVRSMSPRNSIANLLIPRWRTACRHLSRSCSLNRGFDGRERRRVESSGIP